jgi:hypothetical protein
VSHWSFDSALNLWNLRPWIRRIFNVCSQVVNIFKNGTSCEYHSNTCRTKSNNSSYARKKYMPVSNCDAMLRRENCQCLSVNFQVLLIQERLFLIYVRNNVRLYFKDVSNRVQNFWDRGAIRCLSASSVRFCIKPANTVSLLLPIILNISSQKCVNIFDSYATIYFWHTCGKCCVNYWDTYAKIMFRTNNNCKSALNLPKTAFLCKIIIFKLRSKQQIFLEKCVQGSFIFYKRAERA